MLIALTLVNDEELAEGLARNLGEHLASFRLDTLRGADSIATGYNRLAEAAGGSSSDVLCFIHQDARLVFRAVDQERSGLRYAEVETLDGYCLFVTRRAFDLVGGFDEGYSGWFGYDNELCLRALHAGLRNYVIDQPSQHFSWGSSGGEPLVDVIVLSFAKTAREYDMTRHCLTSLRLSGPEIALRIVVVETNAALPSEPFANSPSAPFGDDVQVVYPGGPFGYNRFLQAGCGALADSPAQHLLLLNNDVVRFATPFLREMLHGLESVPSVSPWACARPSGAPSIAASHST